jgi:hypothetical protein
MARIPPRSCQFLPHGRPASDILIEPVSYLEEIILVKTEILIECCKTHVAKCESAGAWRNAVEVDCLSVSERGTAKLPHLYSTHTLEGILLGELATSISNSVTSQFYILSIMVLAYIVGGVGSRDTYPVLRLRGIP